MLNFSFPLAASDQMKVVCESFLNQIQIISKPICKIDLMKFFEPIECQTYMKNMKNSHFLKSCVKNKMINLASKKPLKHSLKRLEIQCSGKN